MRIFFDANILFSAALSDGNMRILVDALLKRAVCLTNAYAVEEARRNLTAKAPSRLSAFEALAKQFVLVEQIAANLPVEVAMKDRPILGGAIACAASHLLTGDKRDFGALWGQTHEGVQIVSPRMLAEELGFL